MTVQIKDFLDMVPKLQIYFVLDFTNEENAGRRSNSRMLLEGGLENGAGHLNGAVTSKQLGAQEGAEGCADCLGLLKTARTSNPDPAINLPSLGWHWREL